MESFIPLLFTIFLVGPIQLSPADHSSPTSSELKWQTPTYSLNSSNPYRIQVDDEETFTTPITKDYQTDNLYYTPTLSPGTYYWRVKAKDNTSIWSDWSSTWQFNLTSQVLSTPNPSATPSATPSPSSTATPTPIQQIVVSNTPSSSDVSMQFNLFVQLSGFAANKLIYLKAAFRKEGSSNYFGQTLVNNDWIKNNENYAKQLLITTDASGSWVGNMTVKGDSSDSGYSGAGDYRFKVGFYLDSTVAWSNETTISLSGEVPTTTDPLSTSAPEGVLTSSKVTTTLKNTTQEIIYQPQFSDLVLGTDSAEVFIASPSTEPISQTVMINSQSQRSNNLIPLLGSLLTISGVILGSWRLIPQPHQIKLKKWLLIWQKSSKLKVLLSLCQDKWEQAKQLLRKVLLRG